jgi:hypothetical protein
MEKVMTAVMAEMSWGKAQARPRRSLWQKLQRERSSRSHLHDGIPSGKLYVSKQAAMAGDVAKITQERMKELTPKIMQIMQSEMQK